MTRSDYLAQLKEQYQKNDPDYTGVIRFYTTEGYDKLLSGKIAWPIDNSYLQNLEKQQKYNIKNVRNGSHYTVDATKYPYNMVTKESVYWNLPNGIIVVNSYILPSLTQDAAVASGFKVSNTQVGTAAHCLWDAKFDGYISGGIFVYGLRPGGETDVTTAITRINSAHVPNAYMADSSSIKAYSNDYGVADISTTWGALPNTNFALVKSTPSSSNATALGYPLDTFVGNQQYGTNGTVNQSSGISNVYESSNMANQHGHSGGPVVNSSRTSILGIVDEIFTYSDGHKTSAYNRLNLVSVNFILNN